MHRLAWIAMGGTIALLGVAACAAGNGDQGSGGETSASGGATNGATTTTSAATMSTASSTASGFNTSSTGTGITGPSEVFGASKDTLYKLDPDTKVFTTVGAFSGCSGVQDIALDKNSKLWATTLSDLYTVDPATAICTHVATGTYPNSLSFVPAGTLDPTDEALVGYVTVSNKNQYVRVDTQTGAVTNVGTAWTEEFVSSGDIVSVIDGTAVPPTYLTVKAINGGTKCKNADCLVSVNPQNGSLVINFGELNTYKQVFGLAFWAGSVYGFDNAGDLFQVDIQGQTNITHAISVPGGLSFWGAGSATSAPPVPN